MVNAVKRNSAVVADDAAAAVGIRQAGDNVALARQTHLVGIRAENAVVVSGSEAEFFLHLRAQLIAVGFAGLPHHAHPAEGVDTAL